MSVNSTPVRMIALLGRPDAPTDALDDYCHWLGNALEHEGFSLSSIRADWIRQGWFASLVALWRASLGWRGRWVLLQYTALSWSRRGVPFGALMVVLLLRARRAKVGVVFHDAIAYKGFRWKDRARSALQNLVMRNLYRLSSRSFMTLPLEKVPWLPIRQDKATFIPVGANFCPPSVRDATPERDRTDLHAREKTVAIFGVTGAPYLASEVEAIARIIRRATGDFECTRLLVFGRHAEDAEAPFRAALEGCRVNLEIHGIQPPEQVGHLLCDADVLLFVRGGVSSRRGSAIAGIACGLPVVGCTGGETGPPITSAGVLLAPEGDYDALATNLSRVLADDAFRAELRRLSVLAQAEHFSWSRIAQRFAGVLGRV